MKNQFSSILLLSALSFTSSVFGLSERALRSIDEDLTIRAEAFEAEKSQPPVASDKNWELRSKHLVFAVPDGVYKVVGWFDLNGYFQARGYVFEEESSSGRVEDHLAKISDIEKRAGLDFFPLPNDFIEEEIESKNTNTCGKTERLLAFVSK